MKKINDLYDIKNSLLRKILNNYNYPCDVLLDINKIIGEIAKTLNMDEYMKTDENIYIHKSVDIGKGVEIIAPAIIMENTKLRHNAYLRGNVIIGPNCVIGNSCEIKNSILLSNDEVPHFNYVGDSILGDKVHLGAGVILANLRFDKKNIRVEGEQTNLRKIGAFIGDNTQIGCNSVIFPGTVIEKDSLIMPLSTVNGNYPSNKVRIERS